MLLEYNYQFSDLEVFHTWTMGGGIPSRIIAHEDRIDHLGVKYPSAFSHICPVFKWKNGPAIIAESISRKGVRLRPYEALERAVLSGKVTRVWHTRCDCSQDEAVAMWKKAVSMHGKGYDYLHILGLYRYFRKHGRNIEELPWWLNMSKNNRYICIEFHIEVLKAGSKHSSLLGSFPEVASSPESAFYSIHGIPSSLALAAGRGGA